jgi:hypothetical protein
MGTAEVSGHQRLSRYMQVSSTDEVVAINASRIAKSEARAARDEYLKTYDSFLSLPTRDRGLSR